MPVTETTTSTEDLSLTIVTDLAATPERAWRLWADPRQLERWWGPPAYPATFPDFSLEPGERIHYWMTGPEGDRSHGWWRVVAVEAPSTIEIEDGFADADGQPVDPDDVARLHVTIEQAGAGVRMRVRTEFRDADQQRRMLEMGMDEGMTQAMGQIDAVLAD